MLRDDSYRVAALRLKQALSAYNCHRIFGEFVDNVINSGETSETEACG
jgi:hypothetical protein